MSLSPRGANARCDQLLNKTGRFVAIACVFAAVRLQAFASPASTDAGACPQADRRHVCGGNSQAQPTVPGAQVRHRDKAEIPRKNLPVYFVLRHAVECICAFHFPAQVVASCRRLNCAVTIKIGAQGLGPGPVLGNAAVIRARLLPL